MRHSQSVNTSIILLAFVSSGCGGTREPVAPEPSAEAKLRDVGELCRVYQLIHKAPPKSIDDLTRGGTQATPAAFAAIRSGEIVLRYQAKLPTTAEAASDQGADEVLAYLKQVPQAGGLVLTLNRRIKTISAEEFKNAKLAGKG